MTVMLGFNGDARSLSSNFGLTFLVFFFSEISKNSREVEN